MKPLPNEYYLENVVVDGVAATRRRKIQPTRKSKKLYLNIPMACISALSSKEISAKAWPLALWVLWHFIVSGGKPTNISTAFALKAGIEGRSARRHAVNALEASGLFIVSRIGREATNIVPGSHLQNTLNTTKKHITLC